VARQKEKDRGRMLLRRLMSVLSVLTIVAGSLCMLLGLVWLLPDLKEGAFYCSEVAPPPGALSSEADYNSRYIGLFPLGLNCVWNMKDGSTKTTFEGSLVMNNFFYGGILVVALGVGLRVLRKRWSRTSTETEFDNGEEGARDRRS
jgi:hypothetical protein